MDSSIAIIPAAMPALKLEQAVERRNATIGFVRSLMIDGTDYGKIPGAGDKPTLLKPGAEKLCTFFGLRPTFTEVRVIEDWTGKDHNGEAFFYYWFRCHLLKGGEIVAEGDGSCNSHESKYRYRKAERLCPVCGKANIRKGKDNWYCWKKTDGCGATFAFGDKSIEGQEVGRVLNPDVADQANTLLKMAQKRALIAATLIGVNASEFFTQDVEDMVEAVIDASFRVVESLPRPTAPQQGAAGGNGATNSDAEFEALERATAAAKPTTETAKKHGEMATVKLGSATGNFTNWLNGFVEVFPYYAKNGKPDMPHILRAVLAEGFDAVTPENLNEVCVRLEARADRKVSGQEVAGK